MRDIVDCLVNVTILIGFSLFTAGIIETAPVDSTSPDFVSSENPDVDQVLNKTSAGDDGDQQGGNVIKETKEMVESNPGFNVIKVCQYIQVPRNSALNHKVLGSAGESSPSGDKDTFYTRDDSVSATRAVMMRTTTPVMRATVGVAKESPPPTESRGGKITLIVTLSVAALSVLAVGSVVGMPIIMKICCKDRYKVTSLRRKISEKVNWVGCSMDVEDRNEPESSCYDSNTTSTSTAGSSNYSCHVHKYAIHNDPGAYSEQDGVEGETVDRLVSFDRSGHENGDVRHDVHHDVFIHHGDVTMYDDLQDDVFSDLSDREAQDIRGQFNLSNIQRGLTSDSDGVVLRVSSTDADEHGYVTCMNPGEATPGDDSGYQEGVVDYDGVEV